MAKHALTTQIEGRVAILTLDHPPRNTISTDILRDIVREVQALEANPQVRSLLLTTAHDTPPFAADAEGLMNDLSWEGQSAMVRQGQRALTLPGARGGDCPNASEKHRGNSRCVQRALSAWPRGRERYRARTLHGNLRSKNVRRCRQGAVRAARNHLRRLSQITATRRQYDNGNSSDPYFLS